MFRTSRSLCKMSNIVDDQAMEGNESVGSVNSPHQEAPTMQETILQMQTLMPTLMQDQPSMVALSGTPLCACSILPIPQYTMYGMPTVVSRVRKVVLQGTIGQTRETIRSKIDELMCQVSAMTVTLTQRVQQMSETITQTQQVALVALQKASEAVAKTTQLRGDMERAIQAQLQEIGCIMDAKIMSVVQELSGRLSAMVTQSHSEIIQRQNSELGTLREELE